MLSPHPSGSVRRVAIRVVAALLLASCSGADSGDAVEADPNAVIATDEPPTSVDREVGAKTIVTDTDTEPSPTVAESTTDSADAGDAADTDPPVPIEQQIMIDQFGYLPNAPKVAVIADPVEGFNADVEFVPGATYEIRLLDDDSTIFTGEPVAWNGGEVQEQSGDRGWWFDFSEVSEPGTYYVLDTEQQVASDEFVIAEDVYDDVLDAALKVFYFNRGNVAHEGPEAALWQDAAANVGPGQDTEARSIDAPDDVSTERDLSGGWFDAGDTNKYVTFATEPVHQLLSAWQHAPEVFDDEVGIPESGNGVPDILDEVAVEIDWLRKMQDEDGGVLTKVGFVEFGGSSIPSENTLPRYYEEVCSSATIAAAGMFAHAAVVFEEIDGLADQVDDLRSRAELAWQWTTANEWRDDCDPGVVLAGDADWPLDEQRRESVVSAVYLFALTGDGAYESIVDDRLTETRPWFEEVFTLYRPEQGDALAFYASLPTADPTLARMIDDHWDELVAMSSSYGLDPAADLYRAAMADDRLHWGSSRVSASIGAANLLAVDRSDEADSLRARGLGHLNAMHGVNPLGLVYLSNMGSLGAERSVTELLHYWFGDGSEYDGLTDGRVGPPPGYVVGGPNRWYSGVTTPPAGQPALKSYLDWNGVSIEESSWEISEPAIYYQSAYVRLLGTVLADGD